MLTERTQIQNAIDHMISFIWDSRTLKTLVAENRSVVAIRQIWRKGIGWKRPGNFWDDRFCTKVLVALHHCEYLSKFILSKLYLNKAIYNYENQSQEI